VHVGAPKTGSTAIQNAMANDKRALAMDKYFIAPHGQDFLQGNPKTYIVDNMFVRCDQIAACVWSDDQRIQVSKGSGDKNASICPDYLMPTFEEFLSNAVESQSDIVISNEWLNRPSSETGLVNILPGWDITIVIFYRRFFDWVVSAHYQWHADLGIEAMRSLEGRVSLVDFIRKFCSRLFEIGGRSHGSDRVEDLTDIGEYTYHIWKRYKVVHENIKIVNFHDGNIIQSFYCNVLHASNVCDMERKRAKEIKNEKSNAKSSTALIDLAIGLHWEINKGSIEHFRETSHRMSELLISKGLSESDLPKECLSERESSLLLEVSLQYEQVLLPEVFRSHGEKSLRRHFATMAVAGTFCSIDVYAIMNNKKWLFLMEVLSPSQDLRNQR